MAKTVSFSVKDGTITGAMRQLLKQLLEKKLVDAVLVPLELPSRENVVQSLVTQVEALGAANLLAPVLPVNTANIVSKMTRIAGLPQTASQRAFDMFLKVQHVQRVNGGGGVVFATGTPISNTMAEAWVLLRYIRPDLMKAFHVGATAREAGMLPMDS